MRAGRGRATATVTRDRTPLPDLDLAPLTGRERRLDAWLAAAPALAIVLLVAVLGLTVYGLDRERRDEARTTLISDALWVEQTLRFQLATDEDALATLALEAGRAGEAELLDRARVLLVGKPEVVAIAWLGAEGALRAALPAPGAAEDPPPDWADVAARAAASARPVYGPLRREPGGALVVDLAAGVPGGGGSAGGALVATVSVANLLARHLPWWVGEKYVVRLESATGGILAEKARVEPFDPALAHRISFDPPLAGTVLAVAPYRPGGGLATGGLTAAIAGLSAVALLSLIVLQRHVARRRRIEVKLRTETAFRRAMEDSLTVGMRARDLEGRILYVNPAFCRMVGFPAEHLVGHPPPMPYWIPDEIEETRARHDAQVFGERKAQSWETRFRRADGTLFDALIYEAPLVDGEGGVRGWMGSIIDITDRKAAAEFARGQAESLQRSARLVALGEMASTLAHELNQPLAAMASYAAGALNLLRAGGADPAEIEGALEKMALQAQRAGTIIRRIQDFARKREPRFGAFDLGEVVRETVAFAAIDARHARVRIDVAVEPDLPPVEADRVLIEQVLLNLLRNGAEAMAATPPEDRALTVVAARRDGEIVVEVADRGPGIDPAVEGRLFDAFVSTKADGMGIGLNVCRSIVELHKGRLGHRPGPTGGTVFTVALPAGERRAA